MKKARLAMGTRQGTDRSRRELLRAAAASIAAGAIVALVLMMLSGTAMSAPDHPRRIAQDVLASDAPNIE